MVVGKTESSRDYYIAKIKDLHPTAQVYFAQDGGEALTKLNNAAPMVLMCDYELPKLSGSQLVERLLGKSLFEKMSIVFVSLIPYREEFVDEIVTGKVQFLENAHDDKEFVRVINKALALASGQTPPPEFKLRLLMPGEVLFNQGDAADLVYIVKTGKLKATQWDNGSSKLLGYINPGEFVGELAYINAKPRSATVEAEEATELIEVPMGTFESVLHSKPTWSKALMLTLTKRLQKGNSKG